MHLIVLMGPFDVGLSIFFMAIGDIHKNLINCIMACVTLVLKMCDAYLVLEVKTLWVENLDDCISWGAFHWPNCHLAFANVVLLKKGFRMV